VTYYGGETPGEDSNNLVVLKTSVDGGRTWTEVARRDPDGKGPRRAFDPQVFLPPDGTLRWTWTELEAPLRGAPAPAGLKPSSYWEGCPEVFSGRRTNELMMVTFPDAATSPVETGGAISRPFSRTMMARRGAAGL